MQDESGLSTRRKRSAKYGPIEPVYKRLGRLKC